MASSETLKQVRHWISENTYFSRGRANPAISHTARAIDGLCGGCVNLEANQAGRPRCRIGNSIPEVSHRTPLGQQEVMSCPGYQSEH